MRSTETATAVTPLATCCSNQSLSPRTRVYTPAPKTPTPSCWGWVVSHAVYEAVRARALVQALVSKSSVLTGRASGSSLSEYFYLLMGVSAPSPGLSRIHGGISAVR